MFSKIIQGAGKVAAIDEVERHVAGMTGGGAPETAMSHGVHDGTVTTGGFAEDGALAFAAATEGLFDERHHFLQEIVLVTAERGAVDVLIATEPGKAVGERYDHGPHLPLADQTVETLGQVLAEILPVGVAHP
jgi:hypothetical protein